MTHEHGGFWLGVALWVALGCGCQGDASDGSQDGGGSSAGASGVSGLGAGSGAGQSGNAGSAGVSGGNTADASTQHDEDSGGGDASGSSGAGSERTFPTERDEFGLGGASHCASADVLLCEGFESGAIDASTWTVDTWGQGSATVDSARAARGTHSLHINEPSAVSRVMLRETKTFATTGNHFFGRFFLYLPYTPDPLSCPGGNCTNLVHWTAAAAGGTYMTNNHPDVRAVGAVNQNLLVNLDGGPTAEVGVSDGDDAPQGYRALDASHVNQWMCFEFEYAGEGDSAEVRVYWDGLDHPDLHYSTTHRGDKGELWAIPKYEYLDFGFTHYQDYGAAVDHFDAWLDEIAVDDQRIGCAL